MAADDPGEMHDMTSSGRLHRATAIIPLAILSAAWTASLAGVGAGTASADPDGSGTLAKGAVIPATRTTAPYDIVQAFSGLTETTQEVGA